MSSDTPDPDLTVGRPAPAGAPPGDALPEGGRQDSGNALPIGLRLDEFELRSVAGEGGFSIVYRAWDHSLNRQVAVKEYFPSGMVGRSGGTQVVVRSERHTEAFEAGLRSFVEEARLLAQFDHPALIKVYRFWKANGSAYMVMPFCEGITLREAWRTSLQPPDEAALLQLLDPLTEALAVLHAERWYHRDIAPDNVMLLAGTRRPLLLDFGAARQVIGDLTHALTVILKPGYAPIEQWGDLPGMKQGPWTDVYALAAMVHFGITGRTPPPSVGRLVNDGYEPLARVAAGRYSDRFLRAIDHALAVRPDQRTASIQAFRAEIGLDADDRTVARPPAATRPEPVSPRAVASPAESPAASPSPVAQDPPEPTLAAPEPPAGLQPPRPARSSALWFAVGLLATAGLGGGGYWLLRPAPPAPVTAAPAAPAPAPATAASAEAPPPVAAAAPAHDPAADFDRIVAAQTPGHGVGVTLARTTLRSDQDRIEFTVQSRQDGHLYVFNLGSDGSLLQLYPNRKLPQPRIRRDVPLNLPRDLQPAGAELSFGVSGPPGDSRLLVMVSALPRDHSSLPVRDEDGFAFYPTGAAAAALSARHAGPLPWIAGTPRCPATGPCDDAFGAAVIAFRVVP